VSAWPEFAVVRGGDGGPMRLDPRPALDKLERFYREVA
jgi:hypothetical protein